MPDADNGGVAIHYGTSWESDDGRDPEAPVVLLADAGYGAWQWSWQYPALAGPFPVVVPDTRGAGESDRPDPDARTGDVTDPDAPAGDVTDPDAPAGDAPERYDIATLADDLEAVLADCGARRAHLVGTGLGGMVALRYALEYSRAATLSLLGTSAGGPRAEPTPPELRERLAVAPDDADALRNSLEPVAGGELLATDDLVERVVNWRRAEDADREVALAHRDAMVDFDASDRLHEVTIPSLVLHGRDDRVVPVENGRRLAENLPKGEFRAFEGEHLFFVTRSKAVNDALVGFLEDHREE